MPDFMEIVTNPRARFRLIRAWDGVSHFDYILRTGPKKCHTDIYLETQLGIDLSKNWPQTEAGTFTGRFSMARVIRLLEQSRESVT